MNTKKILIIEDDLNLRNKLISLLKKNNYDTIASDNGYNGIKFAKQNKPDLIICDIMLPDIDGFEVLSALKTNYETKHLPFIFLTAKVNMEDLRKGMNLGADDYITKPFKINDLLKAVSLRIDKNVSLRVESSVNNLKKNNADYHIFLDTGSKLTPIKMQDIVNIISVGNYTNVNTKDGSKYVVRKLLKEWIEMLPENNFIRIHRSSIVNLDYITKIEKWFNSSLRIHLAQNSEPLKVSRQYKTMLKDKVIH